MQKSQYEVEVLVNGKPLKEYLHEGKIYIEGRESSSFSLRLRNNTGSRKLFVPSIDGLSVMNGKEASYKSGGYIVKPYSSITIDGWRTDESTVNQFYFSAPGESYGARTDKGQNLGVIGCLVFEEKEKERPVKEIHHYHDHIWPFNGCWQRYCGFCHTYHCTCQLCSPRWSNSGTITISSLGTTTAGNSDTFMVNAMNSSSNNVMASNTVNTHVYSLSSVSQDIGTGFGEAKKSEVVSVEFDEKSSPSATFEIYYNTREQLERMGVNLHKEAVQISPQAFPGQWCEPPKR